MKARLHMVSLGCAKNQVDTETMLGSLYAAGIALCMRPDDADILLVNTCAFIKPARDEAARVIASLVRTKRRGQRLVVCGCLAELAPDRRGTSSDGVDAWVSIQGERRIIDVIARWFPHIRASRAPVRRLRLSPTHSAYLRVADGCHHSCSFCTIPAIRGPYRSVPPRTLLAEARRMAADDVVELNLVAQDTSSYGRDLKPPATLVRLLKDLCAVSGIEWIRLQYLYPASVATDLLDVMAGESKVCKYIDIPLQHSADRMLRLMRRPGRAFTDALLARIRHRVPNAVIRTTFIVGHPGEREDDFEDLRAFVERENFNHVGVFEYSDEHETTSHDAPDHVPARVKRIRRAALMRLQQRIALAHNRAAVGTIEPVIIDSIAPNGCAHGRRRGDAPDVDDTVCVKPDPACMPGAIVPVRFVRAQPYDLHAVCTTGEAA